MQFADRGDCNAAFQRSHIAFWGPAEYLRPMSLDLISPTPDNGRLPTVLVDSHCHLDFPDFAGELDAIVGRAQAAGLARIVTISTRVRRHGEVLAIAERFDEVYCSVGTHPHHAHEELDVTADELIARTRHPKVVAIGEAGLDHHYDS